MQVGLTGSRVRRRTDDSRAGCSPFRRARPTGAQSQGARFIEMTRDKVKGAEASGAGSGRFHLMHARGAPIDGVGGRGGTRRRKGKA